MDLKRIKHALALAEEKNFARAAEKVCLSTSAFSRSIQSLEEELGVRLFDRDNRNVAITQVGKAFLERAKQLASEWSCLKRDVDLTRNREIGDVLFGAGPNVSGIALPVLQTLRSKHPGIKIKLDVNAPIYLLEHLRKEKIEFFLADVRGIDNNSVDVITPFPPVAFSLFCRADHPLLRLRNLEVRDVLSYSLAVPTRAPGIEAATRKLLELSTEEELPVAIECPNFHILRAMALESDLLLRSPYAAVMPDLLAGLLLPVPLPNLPLYAEIGIVHLRGRTFSPAAELVIAELQSATADIEAAVRNMMHG